MNWDQRIFCESVEEAADALADLAKPKYRFALQPESPLRKELLQEAVALAAKWNIPFDIEALLENSYSSEDSEVDDDYADSYEDSEVDDDYADSYEDWDEEEPL